MMFGVLFQPDERRLELGERVAAADLQHVVFVFASGDRAAVDGAGEIERQEIAALDDVPDFHRHELGVAVLETRERLLHVCFIDRNPGFL